jgi:hypothetical protein
VVIVALLIVQTVDDARGCGSVDPTDPANYSVVAIQNDTPNPVLVADCRGASCSVDAPPERLNQGAKLTVEAACGEVGPNMTSWRIENLGGSTKGFIAVDTPRKSDGLVYRVSQASISRATAAQP